VRIGPGEAVRIVGERINPTGKKQLAAELRGGEFDRALALADEQAAAGAAILDVNVGAPLVNEAVCLPELVSLLCSRHEAPLSLDSPNMEALEKALTVYPASPLVNSISGEEGRMDRLGPLCRDFGAPFILLPLRGKKLPVRAAERIAILEELLARMEELGIPRRLAIVDALVLAASSSPGAGRECLEFIRYCDKTLRLPLICGLSNISFGLPARELLNSTFFSLAVGAGLTAEKVLEEALAEAEAGPGPASAGEAASLGLLADRLASLKPYLLDKAIVRARAASVLKRRRGRSAPGGEEPARSKLDSAVLELTSPELLEQAALELAFRLGEKDPSALLASSMRAEALADPYRR
jgi:hypothetical protein